MNKNKNNSNGNVEIMNVLNNIKVALYLIVALLVINVVVSTINTGNTWSLRETTSTNENKTQAEEIPAYDVSKFSALDYSGLKKTMKEEGTHVVYIGRETCGYCAMFIPIMTEAQEKYGFKTYYFDISKVFNFTNNSVVDQTAYDELSQYNDFFKQNFLATPMVVIFKDGKFVDGTLGYQDIDTYSSFLEKNKFEKK